MTVDIEAPAWRRGPRVAQENQAILDIYWRRPDGYIIVGPGEETRQADTFKRRGYVPLPIEYAYTDRIGLKSHKPETLDNSQDHLATDRFYWLLRNGGAKEFTVEQIVELHWHVTPPYGMSVDDFPQLKDYVLPEPLWCPNCPGERPPKNSEAELVQHAMIAHQMSQQQAQGLIQWAHRKPTSKVPLVRRADVTAAVTDKFVCDRCGDGFATPIERFNHQRHCASPAAPQVGQEE